MPDFPTRAEFRAGLRRAAHRRRRQEVRLFGPARQAVSVPSSELPADIRAELDELGARLRARQRRGHPQSEEAKARLQIRYGR